MSFKSGFNKPYRTLFCLLALCLFIPFKVSSQDLLTKLKSEYNNFVKTNPERFYTTGKLAQALFFNQQEDNAFKLLHKDIMEADRLSDPKYSAYLNTVLAINLLIDEQEDNSKKTIQKAKILADRSHDPEIKGYVYYGYGWILARAQQETEAVKQFMISLTYLDKAKNSITLNTRKTFVYKELTAIYANWNEFDLQEKYSKLALNLAIKQDDPLAIFDSYMSLGYMYEQLYLENSFDLKFRDLSEEYYLKALEAYTNKQAQMAIPSNLAFVTNNLAHLYFKFYPNDFKSKAIFYAEQAKTIASETNQYNLVASALGIMAEMDLEEGNPNKAKEKFLSSLIEINKGSVQDQQILMNIYQSLSNIYENEEKYEKAIKYHKEYVKVFSSIYDQEKLSIAKHLEAQYEKGKQDQLLTTLIVEAEKKEQQIQLMKALGIQQHQELENMKLVQENQNKELALSRLISEKQDQELRLSKMETQNRIQEINNYQKELSLKDKLNKYYIALITTVLLFLFVLLYAYRQRSKHMKQRENIHHLAIDKERQNAKISVLTALLYGQEQERARVARDLHDGLGGLLSGTKLHLSQINEQFNDVAQNKIQKGISQLDMAVDELRKVAHNLTPDLLQKFGLQEALNEYASRMSNERLDVDVQFLHYNKGLNPEQQLLTYRIVQELVNNAIKHAKPTQIIIQMVEEDDQFMITVEDDGNGFDYKNIKIKHSAGLYNIQSRVEFLKGNLNVESEVGQGTSVEIIIPKSIKS